MTFTLKELVFLAMHVSAAFMRHNRKHAILKLLQSREDGLIPHGRREVGRVMTREEINKRFAELAGICRHRGEKFGRSKFYCTKCGLEFEDVPKNPDFCADPRLVWVLMRKDKKFIQFLVDGGWAIVEERGAIDLIFVDERMFRTQGLLALKGIEWMEKRKKEPQTTN
jgi:predicted Zn-ribbon and HTH transcriptional regulator